VKSTWLIVIGAGVPLIALLMFQRWMASPTSAPVPSPTDVQSSISTTATPSPKKAVGLGQNSPAQNLSSQNPSAQDSLAQNSRAISRSASSRSRVPAESDSSLLNPSSLNTWQDDWEKAAQSNPEVRSAAADALLRAGQYEKAVAAFDRLLVRDADNAMLMTGKAMALSAMGRHEDALPLLENLAKRNNKDIEAQFNYGVVLMRTNDYPAALAALNRVVKLEPTHVRARFNKAVLLQAMDKNEAALELWRQLTDEDAQTRLVSSDKKLTGGTQSSDDQQAKRDKLLSPEMWADAWSHRGELALQFKQPAEAEQCFLKITQAQPSNAVAWCNVGIARADQSRRSDALAALSIALQADPNLVPALNQKAYLQAANYRENRDPTFGKIVVDCCRRSLNIHPNQPNITELDRAVRQAMNDASFNVE